MLRKIEPSELNSFMEFDSVIYSDGNGNIESVTGIYAPNLYYFETSEGKWELSEDIAPWELMNGYSGQYSYSGPIMHTSEFIGGKMARDILEQEGYYVAVVAYYERPDDELDADGWAVARVLPDNLLIRVGHHQFFLSELWDTYFPKPVMATQSARDEQHLVTGELLRNGFSNFRGKRWELSS